MADVNTELLYENAVAAELPDGFKTTLSPKEEDRLRQLESADLGVLSNVVADYGDSEFTERDVIRSEVQRTVTAFQTPERTMELPGTAMEFRHIQQFAAAYKADNETPSGTVQLPREAGTDDIVFTFATPEVYDEVSGTAQDTYKSPNLTGGTTLEVIDQDGLPEGGETSDTTLNLDADEQMFFTGDFIDLSTGKSTIGAFHWEDIDGDDFGPDNVHLNSRLSSTHVLTSQGAWVKSTADLDAKVYEDGDAEIVPVAYYMGPGTKAPALV